MAGYALLVWEVLVEYTEALLLIHLDDVLLDLRRKGVVWDDEFIEMVGERTRIVRFLQEMIPIRGDNAFIALLECLKREHPTLVQAMVTSVKERDRAYGMTLRTSLNEDDRQRLLDMIGSMNNDWPQYLLLEIGNTDEERLPSLLDEIAFFFEDGR
ncbi:unnamed protein product [Darwinula stevensoni]|uniref:CARD domain-containing protein n=1 Tax=Darwinula stevensoni TaxID=69355 RepID=A0A7R9A9E9_9CRUS|nr:unnamed protein product [Darwinula stevensoni]CAG0897333.1 unnamed protein product [Darwinula stevensoni]